MIVRGDLWWVDLSTPTGSGPGYRRPGVVVSADPFNGSRIGTVIMVLVSSNLRLADAPGNVELEREVSGLDKPSVVNVSQIVTLDKRQLTERIGALPIDLVAQVDTGLRLVLDVA